MGGASEIADPDLDSFGDGTSSGPYFTARRLEEGEGLGVARCGVEGLMIS